MNTKAKQQYDQDTELLEKAAHSTGFLLDDLRELRDTTENLPLKKLLTPRIDEAAALLVLLKELAG